MANKENKECSVLFFICADGSVTNTNEARLEFDKEYLR